MWYTPDWLIIYDSIIRCHSNNIFLNISLSICRCASHSRHGPAQWRNSSRRSTLHQSKTGSSPARRRWRQTRVPRWPPLASTSPRRFEGHPRNRHHQPRSFWSCTWITKTVTYLPTPYSQIYMKLYNIQIRLRVILKPNNCAAHCSNISMLTSVRVLCYINHSTMNSI